jgi:hypothetical protein
MTIRTGRGAFRDDAVRTRENRHTGAVVAAQLFAVVSSGSTS